MREIKFRGKSILSGKWVYGGIIFSKKDDFTLICESPSIYTFDEVDKKTVGQFTGLKDKNGVEIYEGDVLDEDDYKFSVVWDDRYCKFYLKHDNQAYQYPEWNRGVLMEVVGNVHEASK